MSCSTASSTSDTLIDASCLQGHWYYFDQEALSQGTVYHEFIFSQDQLMIFTEHIGQVVGDYYGLNGDTLIFGDASALLKYEIISCSDANLMLVNINQQSDTLSLNPYDREYWLVYQHRFSPRVREYYNQEDEYHRAFMMRLKEGLIHYEDLDSTGNSEVMEYIKEVEPILKEQMESILLFGKGYYLDRITTTLSPLASGTFK
ncbi:hypothetical protein [Catalinimonas niigatensis]|uniref:hypothetical protein n=1 Tax=Catalinimonas niigatensis TaxID=1397264 RepID=UPI0026665FC3|nr:hypothetical protein [Catalinimonas niigatensis]WPP51174.1 hypothetical protein PZB72_02055 [Catalinimonas niigatensis]